MESEWVDIRKQPPDKEGQRAIIRPIDGKTDIGEYIGDGCWQTSDYYIHNSGLTHWMPLPGRPEKKYGHGIYAKYVELGTTRKDGEISMWDEMPELKPGMLVKLAAKDDLFFINSVSPLQIDVTGVGIDDTSLGIVAGIGTITEIYICIEKHYAGDIKTFSLGYRRIWKRAEPKEMTVDEISKALGYTVKVIG